MSMNVDPIHPSGWKKASGYSNGVRVDGHRAMVHVAGQIAWDEQQNLVGGDDFGAQFTQALANVCAVVRAGGAHPVDLVSMRIYVTDKRQYLASLKQIGAAWREHIGKHYPAMALVQVADLLEDGALVEIEAVAAVV